MTAENDPVVVDMFCGSGGESQGIAWSAERAGIDIEMYAINHWERAIETHRANFPEAEHICRQVQDINPSEVLPGRRVALLWASPACTHFSTARGGKPCDDQSRVTPFTILDWLDKLTVDRLIVENVPEFTSWGPLDECTLRQIPEKKGETFAAFIWMIRAMGYSVDWKVLNAADYGAPTTRRRLFIQATRDGSGKVLMWPEATHARPGPNRTLTNALPTWIPAREIIDWSIPTQIIDERKKPLVPNTMKRILRGIEKYWGPYARPFLVRYNSGENRIHSVDDLLPVLDTSNRVSLVEPLITCIGHTSTKSTRTRSIREPLPTVVTKEEACLIEPLFIPQQSGGEVRPTTGPLSTIATKGAIGIVEPLLVEYYGAGGCHPASEPVRTLSTRDRFALVTPEPLIMKYRGTGGCIPISEPVPTVTAGGRHLALITPENARIGFRMLKPHELAAAQSFPKDYIFTGNRSEIVKQIGNAVCPRMAEALTFGYMQELARAVA
jgi:DNA (cytosine-5)-methyltransferase 1